MLSPTRGLWVGPTFMSYELPGQDRLAGSLVGTPTVLTGLDPLGYARDAMSNYLAGANAEMIAPQLDATARAAAVPATPSTGVTATAPGMFGFWDGLTNWIETKTRNFAIGVAGAVVAILLIALGLWYLVKTQ